MRVLHFVFATLVILLLAPVPSNAGTLSFLVVDGGSVEFGLEPFQVSAPAEGEAFEVGPSFFVFFDSVHVTLVSGPLLDLDAGTGFTDYSYGAGTVTLDISAHRDDGEVASGQAVLPTLPFSFRVCEGCDGLFGGGLADAFIEFGQGLIDPQLAALLRIDPVIGGGRISYGLENIDGGPDSESRIGLDHRGAAPMEIDVFEAPEPASAWLVLTAGAAWFVRRRARKA